MRLKEYQAKRLFSAHSIPIPRGRLAEAGRTASIDYPVIAKVQTLDGGRGKRGGVKVARSATELDGFVAGWARGSSLLPPVSEVLAEELLDIASETYLSMSVDRERKAVMVMVGREGGVDVESASQDSFHKIWPCSSRGLSGAEVAALADHLTIPEGLREAFAALVESLWRLTVEGDCQLAEINPLVVTGDGRLIAADARVVVDDAATARHPEWPENVEGTDFERAVSAAGAVGTELEGDVAVVTSGAGLGMATLDLVAASGLSPACLVDLGGVVFHGTDALAEVLGTLERIRPRVVFINVFLQVGPCDELAQAVLAARSRIPGARFVLRLRGRNEVRANEILAGSGVAVTRDLVDAAELLRVVAGRPEGDAA